MKRKKYTFNSLFKKYETRLKSIFVLRVHEVNTKQNADLDLHFTLQPCILHGECLSNYMHVYQDGNGEES